MKTFYRISDAGYAFKQKPEYVTKTNCLRNFVKNFGDDGLNLIFDNCRCETITTCMKIAPSADISVTSAGNAGSFLFVINSALQFPDDEVMLFQEDDYIHRPDSRQALLEGIEIANFVSLYDHPDRYIHNNIVPEYIFRTQSSHWRTIISNTMTFGCKVGTLRKAQQIIRNHCSGQHPHDNDMFIDLRNAGYSFISPMPAFATHGETLFMSPGCDWEKVMNSSYIVK